MAALYLRGLPRSGHPPRSAWRQIESVFRLKDPSLTQLSRALAESGHWYEATVLNEPGLLAAAEKLVTAGRVLTVFDPAYPHAWVRELGAAAPPALWQAGQAPAARDWCTVVGSRAVSGAAAAFARAAALSVCALGGAVLSGGAEGVDRIAVRAAACAIEIWPCGLESDPRRVPSSVAWVLSAAAPREEFTPAFAFERNAMLYAGGTRSLVVAARYRQGGSFCGAKDALRRRLGPVFARSCPGEPGLAALIALGAAPLEDPSQFASAEWRSLSPALFG